MSFVCVFVVGNAVKASQSPLVEPILVAVVLAAIAPLTKRKLSKGNYNLHCIFL